jgi:nicotinamidase/pyrazinamidase
MNKRKRVLVVVDYQFDFVDPTGALPVPGATAVSQNIQARIDSDEYDAIVYTFDTHTPSEYFGSDEQKWFPNIHCEFGTPGWNLYNIVPMNTEGFQDSLKKMSQPFVMWNADNEFFFTKNVFDIWAGNPLFSAWFPDQFPPDEVEVDVVGVAQNYCCFMNIMGLVKRNYKVNLILNCTEGIKSFPDGTVDVSFENNNKTMLDAGVNFV